MSQRNYHRWTIRQKRALINLYPTHSYGQIASLLNIDRVIVHNKINKLGLKKSSTVSINDHD